ncbi:MAG: NAD(P)/FAD-dependent oxidoreductase [Deltaproteobacteria bacterium]|nr:NAD(P)/FAD-dependent oxidoreductase [Deltaproteobacteria bacterium]
MNWDVIVIGGGASGLMAAGRAAEGGARVLLLEKMGQVGIKLGLTGKGRCNLTNGGDLQSFIANYRRNGKFLHNAFSRFSNDRLIAFFEDRGLPLMEERGRRIFPASNRAQDVVRVLREFAASPRSRIAIHSPARELLIQGGRMAGVRAGAREIRASRIILASGGASYSKTGSSGDGFRLAAQAGHSIRPIRPALVPLETREPTLDLKGLTLKNVQVALRSGGRRVGEEFGELLFTHFGVSGPVVLTLSGTAAEALERGPVELSIDLKPALHPEQVEARLIREFTGSPRRSLGGIMTGLLPRRMAMFFLQKAGIPAELPGGRVPAALRRRLAGLLKDWTWEIKGARPLEEAIVTAGGVAVEEIHPQTMASRLIAGLYFCGEVIDVDGKTGGYNLQAAFSTGWVAGDSAARPSCLIAKFGVPS